MATEIKSKVTDFCITANRLGNVAALEGAAGIDVLNWLTLMEDLAGQAQRELVAIYKDLADAGAAALERKEIAAAEAACGDTDKMTGFLSHHESARAAVDVKIGPDAA